MSQFYTPPSTALTFRNGMWTADETEEVSYPEEGNEKCFAVEDTSWWFRHRNSVLVEVLEQFPPPGLIYDVGAGNGFQTLAFEAAGFPAVAVEPGSGARNAYRRGARRVIHATLDRADSRRSSLPAVGLFDVLEQIEDDTGFLQKIHDCLSPGGRLY